METFRSTYERRLTALDVKQNIPFTVQVPPGTTSLRIHLDFTPSVVERIRNLLTLTVFDPAGWRGESHRGGSHQAISLGPGEVSPGYLAGPVQPGEWTVFVNTHMVRTGSPCQMRLTVYGVDDPVEAARPAPPSGHTAPRGPGWYRGDLHAHTRHSDARWDVPDLVADARRRKLDFATLSDHNTIAGLPEMDAARSDDLLTMGGMELTTFWGHALVLGLRDYTDWRTLPGQRSMPETAADVTRRGGLFIIAHPKSVGDPLCTGCDWRFDGLMPGQARVVEVWNNDWFSESNSEDNLHLAYEWLNQGHRLALTAGSDNHGGHLKRTALAFNVVQADELSEPAILRAVSQGRLYLSAGPELRLDSAAGDQSAGLGDSILPEPGQPIRLRAEWTGAPAGSRLALVLDGQPRDAFTPAAHGTHDWEIPSGEAHWGLLTLRDAGGKMLALTNPIFWDGRA